VKKLPLDECVPRKFRNYLPGHDCVTVPEVGFAGKKNGELLSLAEQAGFHVFITLDQGIEYEQNLGRRSLAVILIRAKSSRLEDLVPHAAEILAALESIGVGQLVHVG
jgi:hypothetical protein